MRSVLTKWIYWEVQYKHGREESVVYIFYLRVDHRHFCSLRNKAFQRYTELISPFELL